METLIREYIRKNGIHYTSTKKEITLKEYCLGFVFSTQKDKILLVRKITPISHKGLINGIGGHIEAGEYPIEAMIREAKEEIGLEIPDLGWSRVCGLKLDDSYIHIFQTSAQESELLKLKVLATDEISEIIIKSTNSNHPEYMVDMMPNLNWLIPMAKYNNLEYEIRYEAKSETLN